MKTFLFSVGILLFAYQASAGNCSIERPRKGDHYFRILNAIGNEVNYCPFYEDCEKLIKTQWECQKEAETPFRECRSFVANSNRRLYQLSIYKKDDGSYTASLNGPGLNQHYDNLHRGRDGITDSQGFTFINQWPSFPYDILEFVDDGMPSSLKMECGVP